MVPSFAHAQPRQWCCILVTFLLSKISGTVGCHAEATYSKPVLEVKDVKCTLLLWLERNCAGEQLSLVFYLFVGDASLFLFLFDDVYHFLLNPRKLMSLRWATEEAALQLP